MDERSTGREPCPNCQPGEPCPKHCGSRLRQTPGGLCKRTKGQGTDHVGIGNCDRHGGSTATHRTGANKVKADRAVATFGLPREVDPHTALSEEVWRTAGHVAYLAEMVRLLEGDDALKQLDVSGKFEKPSVWLEIYWTERKHLTAVCKAAIDAGVEERKVRLLEGMGDVLASVIRNVASDLLAALVAQGVATELVERVRRDELPRIARMRLLEGGAQAS